MKIESIVGWKIKLAFEKRARIGRKTKVNQDFLFNLGRPRKGYQKLKSLILSIK